MKTENRSGVFDRSITLNKPNFRYEFFVFIDVFFNPT